MAVEMSSCSGTLSRDGGPSAAQAVRVPVANHSPAYKALNDAGLIVDTHKLSSVSDIDVIRSNSTLEANLTRRALAYIAGLGVGGIVYDCFFQQFTVKAAHILKAKHQDGTYHFFGPGVHNAQSFFVELQEEVPLSEPKIVHGNRAIVTVEQGFVGLCMDAGQPVLLAPGIHQWTNDTMELKELIDLSAPVIHIGPFTLVTVDEGYAAITQDNGKQEILAGGTTHMLMHRNWKFQKFISLKIRTDDLGPFSATTADNVVLETEATVNWRIEDPKLAARMAADTMVSTGPARTAGEKGRGSANFMRGFEENQGGTPAIREDVLKQSLASLAAAMGSVRYADDVFISASDAVAVVGAEGEMPTASKEQSSDDLFGVAKIFSVQQMTTAVKHANEICLQYGVRIISINVISAVPVDKNLDAALSAGAVASAGAQQAEIAARGNAKARLISSQSEAEAVRINAMALGDAERLQAQGKLEAAQLLQRCEIAVDLARLEKGAQLIGENSAYFFGAGPQDIPGLLSNPSVMARR